MEGPEHNGTQPRGTGAHTPTSPERQGQSQLHTEFEAGSDLIRPHLKTQNNSKMKTELLGSTCWQAGQGHTPLPGNSVAGPKVNTTEPPSSKPALGDVK